MQYIIGDRRTGRTTKLIDWLLQGQEKADGYPYWSRVIVVPSHNMVVHTTYQVSRRIDELGWNPCDRMFPHEDVSVTPHRRVLADVRKAVWSLNDLMHNLRGSAPTFEYAVDDYDQMMRQVGRVAMGPFVPSIVVLEGSLYAGGN